MKSFIEVIKEADETQAKLKFIQDPKSSSKSIANLARNKDPVVRNAAEEELKRRRDSGDQDAAAHVQPPKDASIHTAQTQVGGEQAQAQEKETKTKEVDPNRIAPVKKGSGRDIINNLKKGKTISGDAPNAIELNPQYIIRADGIKEAAMKSVVFSFGRMNPPTIGHEKLVDKIQSVAKANKADARLFLSRTEGDEKNPLPYSDKLKLAKMAFPGIVQDTPKSMYPAGFIGLLKMLEDKYDKVIIVVGSDRLPNIKALANKYNGSEYKFEEIEVVSAGERDPDEEGVGGMSASKMRAAAKAGDLIKFKSGLPSRLKSAAKLVMNKLKQYLSEDLDEAVLTLSQRLKRRTQMRRVKGKIRLGQRRALRRKATSKVISRRSKRIAIKMMRKRILRGRKYQDLSYSSRAAVDRQIARRKTAIARLAKRIEPKLRQAEGRRRSGQGFKSISLSPTPIKKKKLKEGMSHDNLIECVNAIMKRIIAEQNYSLAPLEVASLVKKSNETGVPVKVIKEVYNRGVASWNMGLRENTTPQQWGFARVNSFLAGGFNAHTADKDLLEQDDVATHGEKEALAKIASTDNKVSLGAYADRGSTDKVKAAAAKKLEELGGKEPVQQPQQAQMRQPPAAEEQPQDSGQAVATVDLNAKSKLTASLAGVITSVIQNNSRNNKQTQDGMDTIIPGGEQQSKEEKKPAAVLEKSREIAKEYEDLSAEREKLKNKKTDSAKQRIKEIDERSKEIKIEYRAMGFSGELTNETYAQSREKYNREDAPKSIPEHDEEWNKSLKIDNETVNNLRSSSPEKPPGNASSAMNEAVSGVGATQIVNNNLDLNSKNTRSRMAVYAAKLVLGEKGDVVPGSYLHQIRMSDASKKLSLPDGVSKSDINNFTKMMIDGPAIRDGVSNQEIISKLDEKQILSLYTATNMMNAKATVMQKAIDKLGWKGDKLSSVSYTGSKSQLEAVSQNLKRIKQEQMDAGIENPYVVNQFGEKLDIDTAIKLAETTGGGENPSDTTILTRNNSTGEVMFMQTSDKSNPKDQLGNTTVSAQFDDYELTLRAKMKAGQISEQQMNTALDALDKTRKQVKTSEGMLANERYAYSSNLLDLIKNQKGGGPELLDKMKNLSGADTKYLDAFLKHPEAKGNGDIEKIQNVLEHMNKAVSTGDEAALKTFNANHQEAMKRLTDEKRWYGSKAKPEMPSLEESNRHVSAIVTSQSSLSEQLDKIAPNLGRDCVAHELMHRGHLTQHLKGALGASGDPATHGCFSLILGDYSPTSEMYQKAMGVDNIKDFLDGFETTPVEITSTKGVSTGGSNLFVAQKHYVDDVEIATTNYDDNKEDPGLLKAIARIYKQYTRTRGGSNWGASMTHGDDVLKIFREMAGMPAFSSKFSGELKERFYNFLSYINESNKIMSVGNQPTVNPKPIHHKASGHKFHIHHMINPNLGMTHQVKHAVDRKDLDIDGDTDQFDKPKAGIPDEIGVGTTPITKKMFAKYSKELAHIHAGEPVDEQTTTPKYTGDENSWYLDASGQKVQVYSQSDLKHPEDVGEFLKNPTPEKDIGPMMSMKDFLKTQPEKKKK